jgi:phage repressor protein C with HTH and peptisase S24 domain
MSRLFGSTAVSMEETILPRSIGDKFPTCQGTVFPKLSCLADNQLGDDIPHMIAASDDALHSDDPLHARLKSRLTELGITPEEGSRRAELDKTYLRKLFERPGSRPRADTLEKLARGLLMEASDLLNYALSEQSGHGSDLTTTAPDGSMTAVEMKSFGELRRATVDLPHANAMAIDVPVLGTAAGSQRGAFQLETANIVDYVRRPPALARARRVYALFIEGESMVPEHNPGDLRFVNPDRPPRFGDSVIVQAKNGEHEVVEATIGHYLRRTPTQLVIGKLNPAIEINVPLEKVIAVHKVLTMNDLFGV